MKEIWNQTPANVPSEEAEVYPVDVNELKTQFEVRWGDYRKKRTVVTKENGGQVVYETYRIPLFEDKSFIDDSLQDFCHTASLLGYRTPISPLLIPNEPTIFRPTRETRGFVLFVLESNT